MAYPIHNQGRVLTEVLYLVNHRQPCLEYAQSDIREYTRFLRHSVPSPSLSTQVYARRVLKGFLYLDRLHTLLWNTIDDEILPHLSGIMEIAAYQPLQGWIGSETSFVLRALTVQGTAWLALAQEVRVLYDERLYEVCKFQQNLEI